jgi:outer membrane protein assembly factor BamB
VAVEASGDFVRAFSVGSPFEGLRARVAKFNAAGAELWHVDFAPLSTDAMVAIGPDGSVYAGTSVAQFDSGSACPGNVCQVAKLRGSDGAVLWQVPTPGASTSVPRVWDLALDGEDVLVATSQFGARNTAAKLSGATGALVWRNAVSTDFGHHARAISPAPADGAYLLGDATLTRLSSTGTVVWQVLTSGGDVLQAAGSGDALVLGPSGLVRRSAATGAAVWTVPAEATDRWWGALALDGSRVVSVRPFFAFVPFVAFAFGFDVHVYEVSTGAWAWGFRHQTGTAQGSLSVEVPKASLAGDRLAFGARNLQNAWDTSVYDLGFTSACDATLRTCAFV